MFLKSYRAKNGVTPEYIEAYSWQARSALSSQDYDKATSFAKETEAMVAERPEKKPPMGGPPGGGMGGMGDMDF